MVVSAGRMLILLGLVLVAAGVVLVALQKANVPLGRLPGDLIWRKGNASIYFPLATCLLLSLVASFVLWLVGKR